MKTQTKIALTLLTAALGSGILVAQDAPDRPDRPERPGRGFRPPMPPVMAALDANKDGTLDAQEIANASAALLKLDKNGDGVLTREELHPGGRPGGPRGFGEPGKRPASPE